jgi:hypothetical protein
LKFLIKNWKGVLLWIVLVMFFLGLRLWRIEERLNFSMDQGMFMSRAREIWQNKEITMLGPTASPIFKGRQFFQGAVIYYSLVLLGLLGRWNPVIVSWEMVLLGLGGLGFSYLTINKLWGKKAAIMGAILFTFWPTMINYSNFIWNPNFLLLVTPLFLWLVVNSWWLGAGVVAGIGLQFHFQFGLIILIAITWLIYKKQNLIKFLFGVAAGYSPLIIFDLRNNFYNINTFREWLLSGEKGAVGLQEHYLLSLTVLLIMAISWGLSKINRYLMVVILLGLGMVSVIGVIKSQNGKYRELVEIEKIIKNENMTGFEVADLTTGDTRFYALRYLLEKDGVGVMGVDEYPKSDLMYVLADKVRTNVWEMEGYTNEPINYWPINDKVKLYELAKD